MRKFISTNLSPSMISTISFGGCTLISTRVNVQDLEGEFYDSINNNGVKGWLEKNGCKLLSNNESRSDLDPRPVKFHLEDGDELYVVVDIPGSWPRIAEFKEKDDLPDLVKPAIIKITAKSGIAPI